MRKIMIVLSALAAMGLMTSAHGAEKKDWAAMFRANSGLEQEMGPPKTPEEALTRSITALVKTKIQADDLRNSGVPEEDPEIQDLVKKHEAALAKTREFLAKGLNPTKIKHPSTGKNLMEWFTFKNSKPVPLNLDYMLVELRVASGQR